MLASGVVILKKKNNINSVVYLLTQLIWALTLLGSLFLMLSIVFEINHHNTFKPDIRVEYWSDYNKTECEINIHSNLRQKDFYNFCPYVIEAVNERMKESE